MRRPASTKGGQAFAEQHGHGCFPLSCGMGPATRLRRLCTAAGLQALSTITGSPVPLHDHAGLRRRLRRGRHRRRTSGWLAFGHGRSPVRAKKRPSAALRREGQAAGVGKRRHHHIIGSWAKRPGLPAAAMRWTPCSRSRQSLGQSFAATPPHPPPQRVP